MLLLPLNHLQSRSPNNLPQPSLFAFGRVDGYDIFITHHSLHIAKIRVQYPHLIAGVTRFISKVSNTYSERGDETVTID